jgi:peptidyl-prolyl cis-trans isomerase SurA
MMVFKVMPQISSNFRFGMMSAFCAAAMLLQAGAVQAQGLRLPGGMSPSSPDDSQSGPPDISVPSLDPSLGSQAPAAPMSPSYTAPSYTSPLPGPDSSSQSAPASSPNGQQMGDEIVAVVNTDVITRLELNNRVAAARATLARQQIAVPDQATLERQVLERMIVERTQLQQAATDNIRIDDTQLDRAISSIATQNKVTVDQMRSQIEAEGLAFKQYREDLRQEITQVRLREREVDSQIQTSEAEIDAYLADKRETSPPVLTLAQILVRVPEGTPSDQVATLRRKAELLLNQARGAADFARLAASSSDGDEALKGGDLGSRPADRWPAVFVQAVANLSPGGISDIIQSGNGFHIIKLVDRKAGTGDDAAAAPVVQTQVRHILIRPSAVMTPDQARQRLLDIRQRVLDGNVSFADMARQYSNDASAPQGGDLGWVSPSETVPEFEHAMDALKPGEISQPVQSPFGWHLIQVLGRRTQDVAQERQRAAARQAIFQRKVDERYEEWARALRDRAYVEIRLPAAPGSAAAANNNN